MRTIVARESRDGGPEDRHGAGRVHRVTHLVVASAERDPVAEGRVRLIRLPRRAARLLDVDREARRDMEDAGEGETSEEALRPGDRVEDPLLHRRSLRRRQVPRAGGEECRDVTLDVGPLREGEEVVRAGRGLLPRPDEVAVVRRPHLDRGETLSEAGSVADVEDAVGGVVRRAAVDRVDAVRAAVRRDQVHAPGEPRRGGTLDDVRRRVETSAGRGDLRGDVVDHRSDTCHCSLSSD